MNRREFLGTTGSAAAMSMFSGPASDENLFMPADTPPWFDRSMRWAQLAFVENDPSHFDPTFWLDYFKKIHADGALLSAGGVVAFYPTEIPLHHRSAWLGKTDPLGVLVDGCRKMNMSVVLRTDPHAARQEVADAHPDWIAVTADGKMRRHWANPELWVTCALGPYNFEFMTRVVGEIMDRYSPEGIFSNRWSGHGLCYCEHCKKNFKDYSGMDLPAASPTSLSTATASGDYRDPVYVKYRTWRTERLKELWFLWDAEIRKRKSTSRFIPNGFPDKLLTGQRSDFFFADQQGRSGVIPPWSNAKHAKELRATMGMKPQVGIFSVGLEEPYRWKDSVQSNPELCIWVSEGVANGLRPCFVKFGAYIYDKRWMPAVAQLYNRYYKAEPYLRNTACLADVGLVYSEQTDQNYGGKDWQRSARDHANGFYHALIEDRMPFEMVSDRLLDEEHLKPYRVLILPNIAALSDAQCTQLKNYVARGGSIVATYETSLYDEYGNHRENFGLADLFKVSYAGKVEGPLQNSYLKINAGHDGKSHSIVGGLEDAYRIVNGTFQVSVESDDSFQSPITIIPSYPDLPMEDVYVRNESTNKSGVYLRQDSGGRVAYIPSDLDRAFWQILSTDHGTLLRNTVRWALGSPPRITVNGPGVMDVTVWRQEKSMTVHLVNLTNPMMLKGPFRELIPVNADVELKMPVGLRAKGVRLLIADTTPKYELNNDVLRVTIPAIADHEIIGIEL